MAVLRNRRPPGMHPGCADPLLKRNKSETRERPRDLDLNHVSSLARGSNPCQTAWMYSGITIIYNAARAAYAAARTAVESLESRRHRRGTLLVRSGVQYNNKTMGNHFGAAHSCSSFADLVKKIDR
jgi:hypothetical protein